MNLTKEIKILKELLNVNIDELSKLLSLTYETVDKLETSNENVNIKIVEDVYNFAYSKSIYFNKIDEELIKEELSRENKILLFHGSKTSINFPIDLKFSKSNNDFGKGFYLGESFIQAGMYISNSTSTNIYSFCLSLNDLKTYKFNVDKEWMIAIAYFRGWLNDFKDSKVILNIMKKIKDVDVIVAPIADNRMFDIIKEFINGEITDLQCQHALAATDLGMQYVLKTEKAINQLEFIKLNYLSGLEKEEYIKTRFEINQNGLNKVKVARIRYRGKGIYVDEVLK